MTPATSAKPIVPNILIVDDAPANLELLVTMLKERGYKPRPVSSGELAVAAARQLLPDLMLLDINMPEMDGYQVCEIFKQDARLQEVPIIFLSALNDTEDKVRAFQRGGVDYITKPFKFEEVEARVHTHLELRRQKLELESSYRRLGELEALRDSLTHMIVHDMRSPLFGIDLRLETLKEVIPVENEKAFALLAAMRQNVRRLGALTEQMLEVSRLEAGQMPLVKKPGDLAQAVQAVVTALEPAAGTRRLAVLAPDPIPASFDPEMIERVLENLVGNALKFTPPTGAVTVTVGRLGANARVGVHDNGPGIPKEYHQTIFDKFSQVEASHKKRGAGLGLAYCKLAVTAHGGAVGLESEPGQGSTFWLTLPIEPTP